MSINQEQLLCMMPQDGQAALSAALQRKDIERFRKALHYTAANPTLIDDRTKLSVFQFCCQNPGHSEFITECIKWGCDVNKESTELQHKCPIHFAAESGDPENLRALLQVPTIFIDKVYENMTAVHTLASILSEEHFESIFQCIKLLIEQQANLNIPNRSDCTPILTLAKKYRKMDKQKLESVLRYILDNVKNIDLDTFYGGKAREILQKEFPRIELADVKREAEDKQWDFASLFQSLNIEEEDEFLTGFDSYVQKFGQSMQNKRRSYDSDLENQTELEKLFKEHNSNETLLTVAIRNNLYQACRKLLRYGADVNNYAVDSTIHRNSIPEKRPIELACGYGNWKILELFLNCKNLDLTNTTLLIDVIKNIGEKGHSNACDYRKCFDILMQYDGINVNTEDKYGNTALYTAVKYNNKRVIYALLEKGAYIGSTNRFSNICIADIDSKVLERHFNNCVTTNDSRSGDDKYQIQFNYSNLVPVQCKDKPEHLRAKGSEVVNTARRHPDEMSPIEYLAKTPDLKHLVKHPLIASFLFLKWHRLSLIFYANFILYSVYCLSIILYLLLCYGHDAPKGLEVLLYILSSIGVIYITLREFAQVILSPKNYFKNKENYLELALIAMSLVVLSRIQCEESTRRSLAAFTILLAVGEFFLLTGSLPVLSFSTHLAMLKAVSKSFLKGLFLYSIILIAFALCFYTLLGEGHGHEDTGKVIGNSTNFTEEIAETKENGNQQEVEEEEEFNKFVHPGIAIIKTVVMLTGEFDASSINFKQNLSSYVIFVIFVFLISTVLFNLLNGLAVSDTQAIKNEAELTHFICRAEVMSRYERIFTGRGESQCCNFILRYISPNLMALFPNFIPKFIVYVLPNQYNKVLIPRNSYTTKNKIEDVERNKYDQKFYNLESEIHLLNCCFGNRCSRMESKIIKYAKEVLENKEKHFLEEQEALELTKRMTKIEAKLDEIFKLLSNLKQS